MKGFATLDGAGEILPVALLAQVSRLSSSQH
jgi:hypothetical protein